MPAKKRGATSKKRTRKPSKSRRPSLMSQAEYARSRDVTPQRVYQLIHRGKLTTINGKIDPEKADKEWAAYDQSLGRSGRKKKHAGRSPMQDAILRKELAKAEIEEMKAAQLRGELVSAAEVKSTVYSLAATVRNALLRIPKRISSQVAAESDQHKVRTILEGEIAQALTDLSKRGLARAL